MSYGLQELQASPFTENRSTRPAGQFRTFGEQLGAVINAGIPGRMADPKLFEQRSATGLNESVGSQGGFLLQQDFSTQLLTEGMQQSKIAQRCRPFPIGSNSNGIKLPIAKNTNRTTGSRWGGIRLYWGDEAEQMTASKPEFEQVELSLKKLTGLCYLTEELLEDVTVLEAFVRSAFGEEFAFTIDDAVIRQTGAGTPLGILNSGCLVTVSKETGQAARTINSTNVMNMYSRLPASSLDTAAWFINQDCAPPLMRLTLGTGSGETPMYVPNNGLAGKPLGTLLGLPVFSIEQCETLGTKGDIILADWNKYLLGNKGGLRVDSSIHCRFLYDERVLRFVYRIDGQPMLPRPITPYKGTNTQSPFIVLETRS